MPESLGKVLKKIREAKHLSIEEISERSRIPKNTVSTIEEDRLAEIKSVFYAKSFVKTYASFLGALNEPVVKDYLSSSQLQRKSEPVSKSPQKQIAQEIPQIDFSILTKYKKQIVAIIIGIFALWALSLAMGHVAKALKNKPIKKHETIVKVKKDIPKKIEEEKPKDVIAIKNIKKEVSNEKSDSVELEVFASENTWLQVTGDGEILFTGAFKKGSKDTWEAKKEIKLEAGNSSVVKINVNGKPASFSGKKGEKKEIIITKDGIKN